MSDNVVIDRKTALFLLVLVLSLVLFGVVYNNAQKENSAKIEENEKLKQRISKVEAKNDSILLQNISLKSEIDSLDKLVIENHKNYLNEKRKYEKYKLDFKMLPVRQRDSIIREYIRANQ